MNTRSIGGASGGLAGASIHKKIKTKTLPAKDSRSRGFRLIVDD
jgi:hypothetical protein